MVIVFYKNSISRLFFNKLKSNLIQKIPVQDK